MTRKIHILKQNVLFTTNTDETVLAAALRQNVMIPYSCRGGSCGTCSATVVQGEVTYPYGEPEGMASGQAFLCQAHAQTDLVIEVPQLRTNDVTPAKVFPARVADLQLLAPDVMAVFLQLPGNQQLSFTAGQYLDVLTPVGRRSFSIANAQDYLPSESPWLELHIRHVEGGQFTPTVFTELRKGTVWRIEAPHGSFAWQASSRPVIIVAGGTGLAPVKSMLETLRRKQQLSQTVHVYWGVRDVADIYAPEIIDAWQQNPQIEVTPVLSAPSDAATTLRKGWVHEAILDDYQSLADYDVYACGPPPLIEAVRTTFLQHGLPEEQLFLDSFEFTH